MRERDTLHVKFVEGEDLLREGRKSEALSRWKECLELSPGWTPAIRRIFAILKEEDPDSVIKFIDEVIEVCGEDDKKWLLAEKAEILLEKEKYEESERISRSLIEEGYKSPQVIRTYLRSLSSQEKWEDISEFLKDEPSHLFEGAIFDIAVFHLYDKEKVDEISMEGRGGFLLERWIKKWKGEIEEFIKDRKDEEHYKDMPFVIEKAILMAEKGDEEGRRALEKCLEIFSESVELVEIAREVARYYKDKGLLKKSLYRLKELLGYPHNSFVVEELVSVLVEEDTDEALKLLEELYSHTRSKDVFEQMLAISIKTGRYEKAGELLSRCAEEVADEDKVALLLDASLWYSRAGRKDKEKEVLYKAVDIEPSNSTVLDRLEGVLFQMGDWDGLVDVYRKKIEASFDPKDLLLYSVKIGEIYENYKNDLEKAAKAYEEVLDISPGYLPAIEALKRVEKKRNNWRKVIMLNERLAEMSSDQARIASLYWENGILYLSHLEDVKSAIKSFERILDVQPENKEVVRILKVLEIKMGDYDRALEYLEREIESTSPDESDYLFFEGAVLFLNADKKEKALGIFKKFIDKEGYRERAVHYLYHIYSKEGKWKEFVEVLKRLISDENGNFYAFLNFLIGKILVEKIGDEEEGKKFLEKAIETGSSGWWSFLKMEEIFVKTADLKGLLELYRTFSNKVPALKESYSEVVSLLEYHIEGEDGKEKGLPLKLWLGEYLLHSFPPQRDLWERMLESDFPSEWIVDVSVSLLTKLKEDEKKEVVKKCISLANDKETLRILEREVIRLSDDTLLISFIKRKKDLGWIEDSELILVAEAEKRRGEIEEAIRWIDEYIHKHPEEIYPLSKKASFLKELKRWKDAVDVLEKWAELEEFEKKKLLLEECAEIYLKELNSPEGALRIYQKLNALFPTEEKYLEKLFPICETLNNYQPYLEGVDRTVQSVESDDKKAEICLLAGKKIEGKEGMEDKAVELYWSSFNFKNSIAPLSELERVFRKREDFASLVGVLEEKISFTENSHKGEVFGEIGHIYYRHLNDVEKGERNFAQALKYSFPLKYSRDLLEVRLNLKDVEKLKEAVEVSMEHLNEGEDIPLLLAVGKFFKEKDEKEWAEKVLKGVLEIDKENEDALYLLTDFYRKERNWEEFVKTGKSLGEILKKKDVIQAVSLYNEMGEIARNEMKDYELAVDTFKNALKIKGDFIEARKNLADLLIELKRDREAVEECRKVLVVEPLRVKTLHFMAYFYENNKFPDKAFCIVEILNLLGEMDDKMEKVIWEVSSKKRSLPKVSFSPSYRERLVYPEEDKTLDELFNLIGPYLLSLYGFSGAKLGMSKEALISSKMSHPAKKVVEEVASFFEIKDYNLYISNTFQTDVLVPSVSPLSVVVGVKTVRELKEDALRYVIGKKVEMAIRGYTFIDILEEDKIYSGLKGFIALADSRFKFPEGFDAKTVSKAIPWLQRGSVTKKIGEVVKKIEKEPDIKEVTRHLNAVKKSAGRVAVFLSKGLHNAVDGEIYLSLGRKRPANQDEFMKAIHEEENILDIFRFYSSEVFFSLRDKFGVSVA